MEQKINVKQISPTWATCNYKFAVTLEDYAVSDFSYILSTLKKWFGDAEYFWDNTFLCDKKY